MLTERKESFTRLIRMIVDFTSGMKFSYYVNDCKIRQMNPYIMIHKNLAGLNV